MTATDNSYKISYYALLADEENLLHDLIHAAQDASHSLYADGIMNDATFRPLRETVMKMYDVVLPMGD